MNTREAEFILMAWRPGGQDAGDSDFEAAQEQVQRDPEAKKRFEAQQKFDEAIAGKLAGVPVPPGLRARILAGANVSRPQRWLPDAGVLLKIAAVLMIGSALTFLSLEKNRGQMADWQLQALDVLSNQFDFDKESGKAADLQAWLLANNAPAPRELPAGLRGLRAIGCKVLSSEGRKVSLICFHLDGSDVHLVVIDRRDLRGAPPSGLPRLAKNGGWTTASWSEGDLSLMLASDGREAELKKLLENGHA